jgi:hypothetical protein
MNTPFLRKYTRRCYSIVGLLFFILMNNFSTALACCLGPGGSGGGNGIIIENKIYLLEFVEAGLNLKANMNFGNSEKSFTIPNSLIAVVVIKYPDHEEYRTVNDTPGLNMLEKILGASSEENSYMFGKKIEGCKDYYRMCLSPESEIAIAIVNRMGLTTRIDYDMAVTAFLNKFIHLNWILVDAPLKSIDDANPSVDLKNKILLARRDDNRISVFSGAWNKGFNIGKSQVQPLNLYNKVGLITHEVFYALTAEQGDLTSDRARAINTELWGFKTYNRFQDIYRKIPGIPAANLDQAYLLSELPQNQELEIVAPIAFAQKDVYAISPDTGLLPHREWFFNYSHNEHSYVEIYNMMNQFDAGTRFPKGLRLKIQYIETELMDNWIQTVVYFKTRSGFPNEINRIFVRASAEGRYPITVTEFEETVKGLFKLVK